MTTKAKKVYHCAQRGCVVAEADTKKKKCPTCNNPLHLIEQDDEPEQEGTSDGAGVDQTPAASGDTPPKDDNHGDEKQNN